ncbi:hypothetical protein D3C81_1919630 [compost metagenome]
MPAQGSALHRGQVDADGTARQSFIQSVQPAVGKFLLRAHNCSVVEPQNGFGPVLVPAHEGDDGIQRPRQLRVQLIHGEHQVVPSRLRLLSFDDARDT